MGGRAIVGSFNPEGKLVVPSTEFEAVSNTPDPTGTYTVWSWDAGIEVEAAKPP